MRNILAFCAVLLASAVTADAEAKRIVALGSSVTEIIYALGEQDRLVGRDRTSSYPAEALDLPDVGYLRALSPEGVLSVAPDMILALDGSGPPETVAVLKEAGVEYVSVADEFSRDGVVAKIRAVGAALGVEAEAEDLAQQVARKMDHAQESALKLAGAEPLRVLFVLSARDGEITVGGANTQADRIIQMAGGVNAAANVPGFKTMTSEALAVNAPDVILMMNRRGNQATSDEDIFALPAIRLTPAGRNKALIRMPGAYLLGFGPRTADAILDLSVALQGINES